MTGRLRVMRERVRRIFLAQRIRYSHEEVGTVFGIKPRTVEKYA